VETRLWGSIRLICGPRLILSRGVEAIGGCAWRVTEGFPAGGKPYSDRQERAEFLVDDLR
jgi:hypothetical protein